MILDCRLAICAPRLFLPLVGFALSAWPCSAAPSAGAPGEGATWYLTSFLGSPIAVTSREVHRETVDGRECLVTVEDETNRAFVHGQVVKTRTKRRTIELLDDLSAVSLEEERLEPGRRRKTQITVSGGKVEFTTVLEAGGERRRELRHADVDGKVFFTLDGRVLAAAGKLRQGAEYDCFVAAAAERGIAHLEAKVTALSGETEDGFQIEVSNVGSSDGKWRLVTDSDGELLKLCIGPITKHRVARNRARLPRRPSAIPNSLKTERVANIDSVRLLTATVTCLPSSPGFPSSGGGVVRDSPYCRIVKKLEPERNGVQVVLRELRPDGRLPPTRLSEEELRKFSSPELEIQSDDPGIERTARAIASGETEPLKVIVKLVSWMRRNMRRVSYGPATASALEAFKTRSGDCTEHSALFCAFTRSLDLPSRILLGLVHDGSGLQFHAWCEVFAEDSWVPVDPIYGRIGVPGAYVKLGVFGDSEGEYHARALKLLTETQVSIEKVERTR